MGLFDPQVIHGPLFSDHKNEARRYNQNLPLIWPSPLYTKPIVWILISSPLPPPSDIHARWWFTDDEALTAVRLDEAWYLVRTCLCVYIGQEQTLVWQYINHNIYNGK
jgi:hypothetical protein